MQYKRWQTPAGQLEAMDFHGIVSASPAMKELFGLIERVARTDSSVLIRGETGTGKELVARAIHEMSHRRSGKFLAINCATLTPELLASELFGHVRGAFTGAVRDKKGLFELADKGTIFLDEVAELPLDLQARLLRVLQERVFVPVGGVEPIAVDVRVLSATNKALREEVEQGRFREDLMYRIRVVPIFLPPLMERSGDIELLTWHFIDEFNARGLRQISDVNPAAMNAMLSYHWPGNIRELRNVLEYAFAIGEGSLLKVDELTPELRGEAPVARRTTAMTEQELERRRLLEALNQARGRKQEAAEILGVSRTTLWRKLKEHGIA
jgi:two-component system, NtrC family, response regulator AtoC